MVRVCLWRPSLQVALEELQQQIGALKRALATARQRQQHGETAATSGLDTQAPPPTVSTRGAGWHAVRRFGAAARPGPAGAASAAGEEDPLVQSYDLLNMRQADLAASNPGRQPAEQPTQAARVLAAADREGVEDDELMVLEGSEEQADAELSDYSEVESDGKEQCTADPARAPHGQHQPAHQHQLSKPAVCSSRPGGFMLGKRPPDEAPAVGGRRTHASCAATASNVAAASDENGTASRSTVLLAGAGPGRLALQQAPGQSFIRNTAAASIGIDRGRYISSGPDGKGGIATAYKAGPVRVRRPFAAMHAWPWLGRVGRHDGDSAPTVLTILCSLNGTPIREQSGPRRAAAAAAAASQPGGAAVRCQSQASSAGHSSERAHLAACDSATDVQGWVAHLPRRHRSRALAGCGTPGTSCAVSALPGPHLQFTAGRPVSVVV